VLIEKHRERQEPCVGPAERISRSAAELAGCINPEKDGPSPRPARHPMPA
jgi:hypothetical protein